MNQLDFNFLGATEAMFSIFGVLVKLNAVLIVYFSNWCRANLVSICLGLSCVLEQQLQGHLNQWFRVYCFLLKGNNSTLRHTIYYGGFVILPSYLCARLIILHPDTLLSV